jgi:hypothetical protein
MSASIRQTASHPDAPPARGVLLGMSMLCNDVLTRLYEAHEYDRRIPRCAPTTAAMQRLVAVAGKLHVV